MHPKLQIIDCSTSCKMKEQTRDSKFCTKKATISDGRVFFECKESIDKLSKSVKQFYSCDLYDLKVNDCCNICELDCVNNQNKKMKDILAEKRKLDEVIEKLRPNMILYGVSAKQVEAISSKYTKNGSSGKKDVAGSEAIKAANFANEALKMILNGKAIDPAFFSLYAKKTSGKIKKIKH